MLYLIGKKSLYKVNGLNVDFGNRDNAEKAINMMKVLLPPQHLMLASAQRVKALILEEMALDNIPGTSEEAREYQNVYRVSLRF